MSHFPNFVDFAFVDTEFSTSSETYQSVGGLQNFDLPFKMNLLFTFAYQWRAEKKDILHCAKIQVDGQDVWETCQFMGGKDDETATRHTTYGFVILSDLDEGAHTFEAFLRSGETGKTAYIFDRYLVQQEWD